MMSAFSYEAINTKIRAMKKNFISIQDYHMIAEMDSVANFIAFLKHHPGYHDIFDNYDEHDLHRYDAERFFIFGFYHDYARIYRFANQKQRQVLSMVFLRHETAVLKNAIHYIYNHESKYDLSIFQEFFQRHSKINVTRLFSSQNLREFTEQLRHTEFYPLIERLLQNPDATPYDYEMNIDIYYFTRVWRLKDKLAEGATLKAITERLGTEIDLLNIMWIYRSVAMYNLNTADILSHIIPINYRLKKEQLLQLIKASSLDEFASFLNNTCYSYAWDSLQAGTMEKTLELVLLKIYKKNSAKHPASMNMVNEYLFQKESEIFRLTTALECIRYGLDSKETLTYILPEV